MILMMHMNTALALLRYSHQVKTLSKQSYMYICGVYWPGIRVASAVKITHERIRQAMFEVIGCCVLILLVRAGTVCNFSQASLGCTRKDAS